MPDPRLEQLAEVLIGYSTDVGRGDVVQIDGHTPTAPLMREVYRRSLRAGGHPSAQLIVGEVIEAQHEEGSDEQLSFVPLNGQWTLEHGDVWIVLVGPENTRNLSGVDPAKTARWLQAREPFNARYLERAASGEFRWALCAYPTEASAQDAGMSLPEFEDVVYRAAFLEKDDPLAAWRTFGERLERAAAFLETRLELRVVAEDTNLTLRTAERTWIRADGKRNMPDGEVFTGPLETSAEGTIRMSFPATIRGRQVEDVVLRFERGEVVEATASRGQKFLRELIGMDEGARRVGEFAFGFNDAITEYTASLLLDEKIGGTIHLALGRSVPGTGGENESALHWDMVCDLRRGGEVYADGELVYRDGAFLNGTDG